MAKREILHFPDSRLRNVAEPVEVVDDEIRQLVDDMFETMYDAPGIGLAAPQLGISKRLIVLDCVKEEGAAPRPLAMFNPEVVAASDETSVYEEGCLSIPGLRGVVPRFERIKVKGRAVTGEPVSLTADGFHARVLAAF